MDDEDLAPRFESERPALTALALRLLGSRAEAEDAVQDAWLRLAGADGEPIRNLSGWLRTVVTRLCLDRLRSRPRRTEVGGVEVDTADDVAGPQDVAELADDVGRVLALVLDTLSAHERVALVVHDMFDVPYAAIAPILGRSVGATKRLASRARVKVRGEAIVPASDLARHRAVIARFLDAARSGDVEEVLDVLAPDVVRTADPAVLPDGVAAVLRGARPVAEGTALLAERSRAAELALVDGDVGLVVIGQTEVRLAVVFDIAGGRVAGYEVIAAPERLAALSVSALPDQP